MDLAYMKAYKVYLTMFNVYLRHYRSLEAYLLYVADKLASYNFFSYEYW